jgi:RNA 2',3'-cyclic 3'-phosphodiesterase
MRLFTGIDVPDAIKERLDILISHLRMHAHLKWSPVYNLHITTKFIGQWPDETLDRMVEALGSVKASAAVEISIRGLGWFPNARMPRVFWAGIEAGPALADLAKQIDEATARLGVPTEDRRFSPHLTLARIKQPVPLDGMRRAIERLESVEFGRFDASCFYLYRSQPGASGSVYTKLHEFPLSIT